MDHLSLATTLRTEARGYTDNNSTIVGGYDYFYIGAYEGGNGDDLDELITEMLENKINKNDNDTESEESHLEKNENDLKDTFTDDNDKPINREDNDEPLVVSSDNIAVYDQPEVSFKQDPDEDNALTVSEEESPLIIDKTDYTQGEKFKGGNKETRPDNVKVEFEKVREFVERYVKTIKNIKE